jgi:hypothetical protein
MSNLTHPLLQDKNDLRASSRRDSVEHGERFVGAREFDLPGKQVTARSAIRADRPTKEPNKHYENGNGCRPDQISKF